MQNSGKLPLHVNLCVSDLSPKILKSIRGVENLTVTKFDMKSWGMTIILNDMKCDSLSGA